MEEIRIERFWQKLWQGCTCTYYELFRTMEQDGILDVDNEVNLLSLHLVFLKRIQSSVDRFESEVYGMDFGVPESVCNDDEESIVVPQLLQVQENQRRE
ncbi:hypothetical protein MAR_014652, partial [Mya arenaria]